MQLCIQCSACGHEQWFTGACQSNQCFLVQITMGKVLGNRFQVQDADDVINGVFIDRQAGMRAGSQLFQNIVPLVVGIDGCDAVTRNHDVFDRDLFEIEDADQHALVAF